MPDKRPTTGNLDSRQLLGALRAVKRGDFSVRLSLAQTGLAGEIAGAFNDVVELLEASTTELERISRIVGKEGQITQRASLAGASGRWAARVDFVNSLIGDLVQPSVEVARVIGAVAKGDLSQRMALEMDGRPLEGEFLRIGRTVNTMVDQLGSFASEVTRVAREVGTEGKLGGQAQVRGVAGIWKDLTDNVNMMAANLTAQVRNIAQVTTTVANGDLSKKITVDAKGEILELKNTINTMVDQLGSFASEVTRVAREVGTDGKLGGQAVVKGVAGTWKDLTDNVNKMAANLTAQVRNIAEVTTAVARGDLSKKISVMVRGEILELKDTINTMVDQLGSFASEVTRVAREVGTEGKLGGQAQVRGVAGIWKDLTDNVNMMAANLTAQVRNIARVVTAVATGDLKQRLTLESKGEIAALANTINEMNDTLATFADQVTSVAREVGVEGKLGGQAKVPGAAGTWKNLTENVNQLAANLTTQVRAIAEVATAVTKGDLTRSITVKAQGEVAVLKDNINEMIRNLKDTTLKNSEQDWLKTNLAKFSRMLQGQKELMGVAKLILSELAPVVSAQHGAFYFVDSTGGTPALKLLSSYAYRERKHLANQFQFGEGLVGQSALEKERLVITEVPDDYIKIGSGLGESKPRNIVVLPVLFEGEVKAVIELASFNHYNETYLTFLDQLAESIGIVLNTIAATMRTEALLKQSQSLAEELQSQQEELKDSNARLEEQTASLRASEELLKKQQEELKQTNEELEEKARELTAQKTEVDIKNREIELAKLAVQERAEQLALTSKYKSEFLANMSHELRTPLNSLLILAEMLAGNPEGNLTARQVECAQSIFTSGSDLQVLINDILDMAKIESGTMAVDLADVSFTEMQEYVERTFLPVAQKKRLAFTTELAAGLPKTIFTDARRLEQVLRNLISNAMKFTERGRVSLKGEPVRSGWSADHKVLSRAESVIAFVVSDTGIGIPADKLRVIFEPFQQADTGTSRKYGGTGLGLSISREIAGLLGGEIQVTSTVGKGSTFTLYLPQEYPSSDSVYPASRAGSLLDDGTPRTASDPAGDAGLSMLLAREVKDDREAIQPGDRVLLIIENDPVFARILLDQARGRGFKGLVVLGGKAGLELASEVRPDAITLDIRLPDMDGWKVLEHLKHDLNTRHIPVQIISVEEGWKRGMKLGAIAYLKKPASQQALAEAFAKIQNFVERRVKNLLVVESDEAHRNNVIELIGDGDVHSTGVATGADALAALQAEPFDCMVLDLFLPDMSGFELIPKIRRKAQFRDLPIIIYSGKELTREEEAELNRLSEASVIKDVRSPERLLDETALFLHRVEANLPEVKKRILRQIHETEPVLANRKVLIVDDDLRNIFALTTILEHHGMQVFSAENGKNGLEILRKTPGIDIVLMDIMMPEMDGYETIRAIRNTESLKSLPIIALTAKAMRGDREKCIEAGASDYIAKPVNAGQLVSLLRVWLYR